MGPLAVGSCFINLALQLRRFNTCGRYPWIEINRLSFTVTPSALHVSFRLSVEVLGVRVYVKSLVRGWLSFPLSKFLDIEDTTYGWKRREYVTVGERS